MAEKTGIGWALVRERLLRRVAPARGGDYDAGIVRRLFAAMCKARGVDYGVGNIGAEGTAEYIKPYLKAG